MLSDWVENQMSYEFGGRFIGAGLPDSKGKGEFDAQVTERDGWHEGS